MGKLAARSLAEQTGCPHPRRQPHAGTRRRPRGRASAPTPRRSDLAHLRDALAESDIVISGTGAGGFILGPELSRARRGGAATATSSCFIDIAVPRDIDPAVRDIAGVHLFDIDDIEAVYRRRAGAAARREVAAGGGDRRRGRSRASSTGGARWTSCRSSPPSASAPKTIRRQELERTLSACPDSTTRTRERIEAMTAAIVKKMLDRPIARLKDGADKGLYMEALEDLFDVRSTRGAGAGPGGGAVVSRAHLRRRHPRQPPRPAPDRARPRRPAPRQPRRSPSRLRTIQHRGRPLAPPRSARSAAAASS